MRRRQGGGAAVFVTMLLAAFSVSAADLRLSHQFPGKPGEWRHQAMVRFADEVAKSGVDLKVSVYPGEQLFKAREQWKAMVEGVLDLSILQLSDNSPVPEMGVTAMPTLIRDHDHADRIAHSPVADAMNEIAGAKGVVILDHFSQAATIGAVGACPVTPLAVNGLAARAPGELLNKVFEVAGAATMALPSNAIKPALQSGALDLVVTASQSYLSFGLESELKCLVVPGKNGIMTMLVSLVMSKKSWDALTPAQQAALKHAADAVHPFAAAETRKVDLQAAEQYRAAGATIAELTQEQFGEWRTLSERAAFAGYAAVGPQAQRLLDLARAVQ